MQQENDKEMSFEFGYSKRYILWGIISSTFGTLAFLYMFYLTYVPNSGFGGNSDEVNLLLRLMFFLAIIGFVQDFTEYWQRLKHYNGELREVYFSKTSLYMPKSFKAKAISEIKWQEISSLEIDHYNNGIRYFYLIKKQKKLLINTDTKTYEIRKEDLTNKAEFKQLCLAIASRTKSKFEDKNGDLWI